MVHIVLCTTSLETKKTLKPLFFCNDLAFVDKQHKPDLVQKKTLIVHIGFLVPEVGFVSKVN